MERRRVAKEPNTYRTLAVEAGQVMCPRQGIVDVDRCWSCPAYDSLSSGWIEGVVCKLDLAELRSGPQSSVR
jgi:hypothetical protein